MSDYKVPEIKDIDEFMKGALHGWTLRNNGSMWNITANAIKSMYSKQLHGEDKVEENSIDAPKSDPEMTATEVNESVGESTEETEGTGIAGTSDV